MARKSNAAILADLRAEPDGLSTRDVGLWTLDKLGILLLYAEAFTTASKTAKSTYYVDGLAGSGICRVRENGTYVWGSALIALKTQPPFSKCILVEKDPKSVEALEARVEAYGSRAEVVKGDVNLVLPSVFLERVPRRAPCFCFLDPAGAELKWETIAKIAAVPGRHRRPELLILFPLQMSLRRLMTVISPMPQLHREMVDSAFGTTSWSEIHEARRLKKLTPAEAKTRYVELYCQNLKALGYKSADARVITAQARGKAPRQERYYLVFATDHPDGRKIMSGVFKRWYSLDAEQPTLFDS